MRRIGVYETFYMKTSKVFVGDICYALDTNIYHKVWGDQMNFEDGIIEVDETPVAVVGSTANGDGDYYGMCKYAVDAGVIGVTDLNYRDDNPASTDEHLNNLGIVVNIPSGKAKIKFSDDEGYFSIRIYDDTKLIFQDEISTDWVEDEDEDDDEEDWEEAN